jgi:hypothetical protein
MTPHRKLSCLRSQVHYSCSPAVDTRWAAGVVEIRHWTTIIPPWIGQQAISWSRLSNAAREAASVNVIEFADFQVPFCASLVPALQQVRRNLRRTTVRRRSFAIRLQSMYTREH